MFFAVLPCPPGTRIGFLDVPQPLATNQITANQASFNFGSLAVGTAGPTRLVAAVIHWYNPNAGADISLLSATIGGNAATIVAQAHLGNTTARESSGVAIISYPLTAGASATFAITLSGNTAVAGVEVYALHDLNSNTVYAIATNTDSGTDFGGDNITSTSINVPASGILMVGGTGCWCDTARTWSSMTEDFGENDFGNLGFPGEEGRRGCAADGPLSAQTGKTVSIGWGYTVTSSQVAATWA